MPASVLAEIAGSLGVLIGASGRCPARESPRGNGAAPPVWQKQSLGRDPALDLRAWRRFTCVCPRGASAPALSGSPDPPGCIPVPPGVHAGRAPPSMDQLGSLWWRGAPHVASPTLLLVLDCLGTCSAVPLRGSSTSPLLCLARRLDAVPRQHKCPPPPSWTALPDGLRLPRWAHTTEGNLLVGESPLLLSNLVHLSQLPVTISTPLGTH